MSQGCSHKCTMLLCQGCQECEHLQQLVTNMYVCLHEHLHALHTFHESEHIFNSMLKQTPL